jgi:excinuclease ABC subunit C
MHEVVTRRYKRLIEENAQMPDLIVIDGGPGQVNAAKTALHSLGLQLPLIGLAKEREEIYLPNEASPLQFKKTSRMMLLLRQIRDATHDFALGYNRKRRQMQMRDEFNEK